MYIQVVDGTPREITLAELRAQNPKVSFPRSFPARILAKYGVYEVVETEKPAHDPATQALVESIEEAGGRWERRWVVSERTMGEARKSVMAKVAREAALKAAGGAIWTHRGVPYRVDTSSQWQARVAVSRAAAQAGDRPGSGRWRIKTESGEAVFADLNANEVRNMAAAVAEHVERCHAAEGACYDRIMAATTNEDLREISFEAEFDGM